MLRRLAKHDGEVAKIIAPIVAFFAARHPLVKAEQKAKRGGGRKGAKSTHHAPTEHPPVQTPPAEPPATHGAEPANGTTTEPTQHAAAGSARA
jgi:hypothetical protein